MFVPKLARNGFYSSSRVQGQSQVSSVSMPSIAISPFPEHEPGIRTIFSHFRNIGTRMRAIFYNVSFIVSRYNDKLAVLSKVGCYT